MVKTAIDLSTPISTTQIMQQNDTKPDCDSFINQHLLENEQCALNHENKRFSILAIARSSFNLNLLEAAYFKTLLRLSNSLDFRKNLFTLSNSLDNWGVPIWPLAALSLTFRYCKIFLCRALQYQSYIIGLPRLPTVQINHEKRLLTLALPLWCDTAIVNTLAAARFSSHTLSVSS